MSDLLRHLAAALREAAKDSERLNWLDGLAHTYYVDLHSKCAVDDELPTPSWCLVCFVDDDKEDEHGVPQPDGPWAEWFPTIREVIDAAMSEETPDA